MNLKDKLAEPGRRLVFEVCILSHAVTAQAIAAAGADIIMLDFEHAATTPESLHAMIAATAGTGCAPMVRVLDHNPAGVKLALDLGAEGIVFPLVRSVAEAEACVAAMRYPPRGVRGWGPFIAHSRWQVPALDYAARFGDKTVCCLLIETAEAVADIDAILAVDGVDFAFVAQFDLSTSLGVSGQFDHPDFIAAVAKIEAAAAQAGVPLGGGPTRSAAEVEALFAKGYRIVGNFDLLRLKGAIAETVAAVRGG